MSLVTGNVSSALENVLVVEAKLSIFPGKQGNFSPFLLMMLPISMTLATLLPKGHSYSFMPSSPSSRATEELGG